MPRPRVELAATFLFDGVAEAYRARPPYPVEAIDQLAELGGGGDAAVLDLGSGEGAIARPLAPLVATIDAVEVSPAMIRVGQGLAGGDAPNLTWHAERAEQMSPTGPFDLVVAGAAMHWLDLGVVCEHLIDIVVPAAPLALCDRSLTHPGLGAVGEVIARYSRAPEHDPDYSVADDLTDQGLWVPRGTTRTRPVVFRQTPQHYLLGLRSTSTLARELMGTAENDSFDQEILDLARTCTEPDGLITFSLTSVIIWGTLVP